MVELSTRNRVLLTVFVDTQRPPKHCHRRHSASCGTSFKPPSTHSPIPTSTPAMPWKGTKISVIAHGHPWRGKTGNVIDVNIMTDPRYLQPILQVLVQLHQYDANAPFPSRWFPYSDIIEAESWLPLNEAQPLSDVYNFFLDRVPYTNVLREKGRRIPPESIAVEEPSNATQGLIHLNDVFLQRGIHLPLIPSIGALIQNSLTRSSVFNTTGAKLQPR